LLVHLTNIHLFSTNTGHVARTPEEIRQQQMSKALFIMAIIILMIITLF